MGAITYTEKFQTIFGNKRISVGTITFSSSYAANGDTISFVGLMGIKAEACFVNTTIGGYAITPNAALTTILAYEAAADGGALDEVTATTDLSAETALIIVIGE